eukprot:6382363-Prymnesium_polylepis.1
MRARWPGVMPRAPEPTAGIGVALIASLWPATGSLPCSWVHVAGTRGTVEGGVACIIPRDGRGRSVHGKTKTFPRSMLMSV